MFKMWGFVPFSRWGMQVLDLSTYNTMVVNPNINWKVKIQCLYYESKKKVTKL